MDPAALDKVIHVPARLKLMTLLARSHICTFPELSRDAGLTAGNTANHIKALEEAGYVRAIPGIFDLKPRTRYAITEEGRAAFARYCETLLAILREAQGTLERGG